VPTEMIARMMVLVALSGAAVAAQDDGPGVRAREVWDVDALMAVPPMHPAPEELVRDGLQALFYDCLPWQGGPTRSFAYMGLPEVAAGESAPGMVLVHGGGGTAYAEWVRIWNERGYAAIAMDTCGCVPVREGEAGAWSRHEMGGPPGWGGWEQGEWPREDQWTWHAVADILLAHSLLAAQPGVDPERIGITGISWGGYLTSLVAGVDPRLKLAIPVYGCGFYPETHFQGPLSGLTEPQRANWLAWWDPSNYLPDARMPMLWVNGTNDFAYWLPAFQKSYRAAPGPHTLCVRVRMPHGHQPGWAPAEIYVFADSILRDGQPLARVVEQGRDGARTWMRVECPVAIERAELHYTCDTGEWPEREWLTVPAARAGDTISAAVPEGATVWYLSVTDERGLLVCDEHEERREAGLHPTARLRRRWYMNAPGE